MVTHCTENLFFWLALVRTEWYLSSHLYCVIHWDINLSMICLVRRCGGRTVNPFTADCCTLQIAFEKKTKIWRQSYLEKLDYVVPMVSFFQLEIIPRTKFEELVRLENVLLLKLCNSEVFSLEVPPAQWLEQLQLVCSRPTEGTCHRNIASPSKKKEYNELKQADFFIQEGKVFR